MANNSILKERDVLKAARGIVPDAAESDIKTYVIGTFQRAMYHVCRNGAGCIVYRRNIGRRHVVELVRKPNGSPLIVTEAEECVIRRYQMNFLKIGTPDGYNCIYDDDFHGRFTDEVRPLFSEYYGKMHVIEKYDLCAVTRKGDGKANIMNIINRDEKDKILSVFSEWLAPETYGFLSHISAVWVINGELQRWIYFNPDDAKDQSRRLILLQHDDDRKYMLVDGTGRIILEEEFVKVFHAWGNITNVGDIYEIIYIADNVKKINILYYDERSSAYRIAFDEWGFTAEIRMYPYDKVIEGNSYITLFYDADDETKRVGIFDATNMEPLMDGESVYTKPLWKDNWLHVPLVAVYRRVSDNKSFLMYFHPYEGIPRIFSVGDNYLFFDKIEVDYKNHFVRGHVGSDVYMFDLQFPNTPENRVHRTESDPVFAGRSFVVYNAKNGPNNEKYAVNDKRDNGKMLYFDDIRVVHDNKTGKECLVGYNGNNRETVIVNDIK